MGLQKIILFSLICWISTTLEGCEFSAVQFLEEIQGRKNRIIEVQQLESIGKKYGVDIFFMGGTAASLAHYIWLDLTRECGDTSLNSHRFHYFWTQIYHDSQDLDLAIDWKDIDDEHHDLIIAEIIGRFPTLRVDIHPLNPSPFRDHLSWKSFDFQNQNTDSLSTALIEITGDRVEDLKGLRNGVPWFASSIYSKTIHYFRSEQHYQTERARAGLNPEFLSAVRYLINMSRFDLAPESSQINLIQQIIDQFDPLSASETNYVVSWLEKNSKKIVTQAFDIEKTFHYLQNDFKILPKLLETKGLSHEAQSSLWWLSRKPLPTLKKNFSDLPATIKTAKDFHLSFVAHGTSYSSWRSITWNPRGKPNFIQSINDIGQKAYYGDGVYALSDHFGIQTHDGYHVRLMIAPEAIEGIDFKYLEDDIVVILNRDIVKVDQSHEDATLQNFIDHLRSMEGDSRLEPLIKFMAVRLKKLPFSEKIQDLIEKEFVTLVNQKKVYLAILLILHLSGPNTHRLEAAIYQHIHKLHRTRFWIERLSLRTFAKLHTILAISVFTSVLGVSASALTGVFYMVFGISIFMIQGPEPGSLMMNGIKAFSISLGLLSYAALMVRLSMKLQDRKKIIEAMEQLRQNPKPRHLESLANPTACTFSLRQMLNSIF